MAGTGSSNFASTTAETEESLERLFRLTVGRRLYVHQRDAVGADVSRAGYGILRILDQSGPLGTTDLANRVAMDPGATVRQVKAMEKDGLVSRTPGDDARMTVVAATERGREVFGRIVDVRTAHLDRVLGDWSAADRTTLTQLVDRLVEDLSTVSFQPTTPQPKKSQPKKDAQ